ncbi:MAG: DUF3379 domain-containing protein [Duncaniella sp.]|nr:DUF3379 domain-containing protein [Duncaniella sp.]
MKQQTYMTAQQLEELIDAYFDCRLSRIEETDLRRILAETAFSTPKINECRLSMGMELHLKQQLRTGSRNHNRSRAWLSLAASVAVLVAISYTFVGNSMHTGIPSEGTVSVYIAGKEIKDYAQAKEIAEKSQEENMAMMRDMLNEVNLQQSESKKELMIMLKSN